MSEAEFWLSRNLREAYGIPDDAREWLMSLWNLIQVFDDMADGDFPDRDKLDIAIFDAIAGMPDNPFFVTHRHILIPLLSVQILKWKASDTAEREGNASALTYAWRAGYYDIVLAVFQIVHGTEAAMQTAHRLMELYGEPFTDYMKEMECRVQQ